MIGVEYFGRENVAVHGFNRVSLFNGFDWTIA